MHKIFPCRFMCVQKSFWLLCHAYWYKNWGKGWAFKIGWTAQWSRWLQFRFEACCILQNLPLGETFVNEWFHSPANGKPTFRSTVGGTKCEMWSFTRKENVFCLNANLTIAALCVVSTYMCQNIQDLSRCLAGSQEVWWVGKPSEPLRWHAGLNQGG